MRSILQRRELVTFIFLGLAALGSAWMYLPPFESIAMLFAFDHPSNLVDTQHWWRLLTPVFIHFSLMHIIFNALWLYFFGIRIELLMGHLLFALFLVAAGIFSNLGQYYFSGQSVGFGGLSGIVYALVGFIAVFKWQNRQFFPDIQMGLLWFMLIWLAVGFSGVTEIFGLYIANMAHLVGLLVGLIVGAAFLFYLRSIRPKTN